MKLEPGLRIGQRLEPNTSPTNDAWRQHGPPSPSLPPSGATAQPGRVWCSPQHHRGAHEADDGHATNAHHGHHHGEGMIVHVPVASPYTKLYFHSALPWISSTAPPVLSPGQLRSPLPLPSRMLRPTLSNAKDRHAEDPGDA